MKSWFKNLFVRTETKIVTVKEKRPNYLEIGKLYILITNNQDNLSVAEYLGEQEHYKEDGSVKFSLSIFKDVVTKDEYFSLGKHIAFTEKRLKALSNMHYTDVVELMFHTEYEYECKDAPTKDVYIDPLENFEIIMNAIRGEYK
mgnify:FL=1|jgi:hypothetical protein